MKKEPAHVKAPGETRHTGRVITKFAEYVGSFAVEEADWQRRMWMIEEQMLFLKDCPRRRSVMLKFCLQGVKMHDAAGETLLMAHSLRRIQYTSCRPDDFQFAFVSRNPHGPAHQLFCHLFVGNQPSEVQVLNLLLCRSFQLRYLVLHPEVRDPEVPLQVISPQAQGKGVRGGVVREPLDPGEVSQNVNALVSFRRLPFSGEDEFSKNPTPALEGVSVTRSTSLGNPHWSPTLVRKKAIRSKVIRSGAYRCPRNQSHVQRSAGEMTESGRADLPGCCCCSADLSENMDILMDAVWFYAGISRDSGIALLTADRLGAFLLRATPGCVAQWTLFMRTKCGVVPYKVYTTQQGRYCFEHLTEEFDSIAALVEHLSGTEGNLFYQLAHGRVNPCYEDQDSSVNPPGTIEPVQNHLEGTCNQKEPLLAEELPQTELFT
ncbi:SH2 domain-containing protein 5 isoform X1 [Ascaphus truei]|uniref:SH2 domain-containing protein 5 isoform X1 n=1 Tax=Ascaphus truei TaxID=8439 RepID=UPI003F599499